MLGSIREVIENRYQYDLDSADAIMRRLGFLEYLGALFVDTNQRSEVVFEWES